MRKDVEKLAELFPNPKARTDRDVDLLNWPNAQDIAKRYETLLSLVDFAAYSKDRPLRLLDLGCGLGMLLDYLAENDLLDRVDYTGVDLVDPILTEVRRRWPDQRFHKRDVRDDPFAPGAFDYCVMCGIFTVNHGNTHAEALALAHDTLRAVWPTVTHGLAFNAMSKHVDWERDDLFHWPLDDIMAFCKRDLSRHVAFCLDYGLWEASTLVRRTPREATGKTPPGGDVAYDLTTLLANDVPLRFGDRSATGCDRFDYAPGKPNLFMLMNLKQLLVQAHGIEPAFALYRDTIPKQRNTRLTLSQLASQHDFALSHALSFHEIISPGEAFTIQPPRVIGMGNHRTLHNVTRSFYVACLADARLSGRSSVIQIGNLALVDYQADELSRIDDQLDFDPTIFHRDGDHLWTLAPDQPPLVYPQALSLLGNHTDFFGNWLCESIPKYVAATLSGHLPPVPVLIDADMNASHRQALEMMLVPGTELITVAPFQPVQVDRLWFIADIGHSAYQPKINDRFNWDYTSSSPTRFLPVEVEMKRRADLVLGTRPGPDRLFLARRDFRHRKMHNTTEIEAIAAARGFAVVYAEDYDFIEQVRLVRNARHVVAPEGSSLYLSFFLGDGARICILNHQQTEALTGYNGGTDAHHIELTIITGPAAGTLRGRVQDMDYQIDPTVFKAFLDEWSGPA